jgi:hypothetical protein
MLMRRKLLWWHSVLAGCLRSERRASECLSIPRAIRSVLSSGGHRTTGDCVGDDPGDNSAGRRLAESQSPQATVRRCLVWRYVLVWQKPAG